MEYRTWTASGDAIHAATRYGDAVGLRTKRVDLGSTIDVPAPIESLD
jgi:hypothetical protein